MKRMGPRELHTDLIRVWTQYALEIQAVCTPSYRISTSTCVTAISMKHSHMLGSVGAHL